ncbi:uncharacterized protein MONOS_17798 [Monocercomonoides exilis]|uniref:uncharacterized protein n=1 Tax=Monocercomonoides exilis TaxID=2049356 RepID=UPI00355953D0|nr:hypothetical protein MONOS_17798 [Monocercomonoides exilis]
MPRGGAVYTFTRAVLQTGRVYCNGDKAGWLPDVPAVYDPLRVDSAGGSDDAGCGKNGAECRTIAFAVTQWVSHRHTGVVVCSEVSVEKAVSISGLEICISKDAAMEHGTIRSDVESGSLFSVGSGKLELEGWTVIHDTGNSRGSSLFAVDGYEGRGKIAIEDCQVENVCLEGCNNEKKWKRGVAEKALEAGEMFEFGNVTMTGCRCSAGDGGAIWVEMVGGSCARIGSESSVTGMKQCWAERGGEGRFAGESRGGGICLVLKDGGEDFCVARPLFEEQCGLGAKCSISRSKRCREKMEEHRILESRWCISCSCEKRSECGRRGVDVSACGFAKYQCKTMDYAFGQQEGMHLVLYNKSYTWRECLVLDGAEDMTWAGKRRDVGGEDGWEREWAVRDGEGGEHRRLVCLQSKGREWCADALFIAGERRCGCAVCPVCFVCVRREDADEQCCCGAFVLLVEPFVRCSGTESETVMMQATFADTTSWGEERLIVLRDGSTAKISKSAFESSSGSKQPMIVVNKARKTNVSETSVDCSLSGQGDGCFLRGTLGVGCEIWCRWTWVRDMPKRKRGMLRLVLEGGSKLQIGRSMETIVSKCKAVFAAGSGGYGGGMYLETNSSDVNMGLNAVKCGYAGHGCETMDFVMARWVEENGLNASISNTVPLYSEASLVSGRVRKCCKETGWDDRDKLCILRGLKITGPASLNTRFYLICTWTAYSMIACTGGQTTLNDVTIRNAVCACGAMIWITGEGSCTMDECTMMNAKGSEATDGCVVYASSGTLEIGTTFSEEGADDRSGSVRLADKLGKWMGVRNCTFRGLSRNGEKGCVLFGMLDEGMVLELNDVNMENCTVSGGSGGGCFVELSKTARLRVGESGNRMLAEGCRALAGECGGLKGFGGGMLVKCIEEASDMIIAGVKFGEGEKANMADKGGNNVAGNVFVGDKGCDYVLCGFEDYPCRGIVHAAALRKGSENVVVTLLADFGHERMVHGEGEGESDWLIETKKNITFEDVSFGMPPSFNYQRESFLRCSKDKLELRRSMELCAVQHGLVDGRGLDSKVELSGVKFEGISVEGERGVVQLLGVVCGCASVNMKGLSIWNVSRTAGSGGAFSGEIGEGCKCEIRGHIWQCELWGACWKGRVRSCGVMRNGKLIIGVRFEKNGVDEEAGFGGGLFARFVDVSVKYSMKHNTFAENKASVGKDVYVICPQARKMLYQELWEGTVEEDDEKERFWVDESSGVRVWARRNTMWRCVAWVQSNERKSDHNKDCVGHILGSVIDRDSSLAIEGAKAIHPELEIKQSGQLCVSHENISLSLRGLTFRFATELSPALTSSQLSSVSSFELNSVFAISCGRCAVTDCAFGRGGEGGDEDQSEVTRWLVYETGGAVEMSSVQNGLPKRHNFHIATDGPNMFESRGNARVEFSMMNVSHARAEKGRFVTVKEGSSLMMGEECALEGCGRSSVNGSFACCEMSKEAELKIESGAMSHWACDNEKGYGGCLFVKLCAGFRFELASGSDGKAADLKGIDATRFPSPVDLRLFLIQAHCMQAVVSSEGYDTLGCGVLMHPCQSFWRLLQHAGRRRSKGAGNTGGATVSRGYDMSSFVVASLPAEEYSKLHISHDIQDGISGAVFWNAKALLFRTIKFSFPPTASSAVRSMIASSSASSLLSIINCSISKASGAQFNMWLYQSQGELVIESSSYTSSGEYASAPFSVRGTIGGDSVKMEDAHWKGVHALKKNGKGGALYVDGKEAVQSNCLLLKSVNFAANHAQIGEHMFVACKDLNATVTKSSFMFSLDFVKEDDNGLMGSDAVHNETTLLRFLVQYKGSTVHIARAGVPTKIVVIDGGCNYKENGVLSDYEVKSIGEEEEEQSRAELCVVQGDDEQHDRFICRCAERAVLLEGMTVSRSSFGRSLMEIASHVDCVLDSVSAELINVEEGCIISMRDDDSEQMNSKNAGAGISLNKCSFKNITNNGESGSVVVVGGRGSGSKLCINSSMLEMCTSSNSQKGGAILFRLSSGGCLDVRFDSNIAHIGRDLFVECNNIKEQINETQFQFDLRESKYNRLNAIFGIDRAELCVEAVNLIEFIVIYQNDTIFTSSDDGSASEDSKNCGTQALPCLSVGYAVGHLTYDFESQIVVVGEGLIGKEVDVANVSIRSRGSETALLRIGTQLECTRQYVVLCSEAVFFRGISFVVCAESMRGHGCFVECSRGTTQMTRCSFRSDAEMGDSTKINAILVQVEARGCLQLENTTLRQISSECPLIACEGQSTLRCTS